MIMNCLYVYLLLATVFKATELLSIPKVLKVSPQDPLPLSRFPSRDILNVECAAEGNPSPILSWEFDGKKITTDSKYRISKGGARLQVFDVTESDAGVYKCIATNSLGSVFGQVIIHIHSLGNFDEDSKAGSPKRYENVFVGRQVNITCPKHSDGLGQLYYWGDLPNDAKPLLWGNGDVEKLAFVGKEGQLIFSYLTDDHIKTIRDIGGISCILYQLRSAHQSVKIELRKMGEANQLFKPTLYNAISTEQIAIEDEGFKLICGAAGRPMPAIKWYKDNKEIIFNSTYSTIPNAGFLIGSDMQLNLKKVVKEHEGTYKCVAENSQGKDKREGFLKVHGAPKWKKEFKDLTEVIYGQKLRLECEANSTPPPSYDWYFNNTNITATTKKGRTIKDNVLEVAVSDFNDNSLYMCVASNYLGTAVTATLVKVKATTPEFPIKLPKTTYFFKGYENTIKCHATGAPKPSLTWHINKMVVKNTSKTIINTDGTLIVKNVDETDGGMYTCSAKNIKATVEDSTKIKVVEKTVITKPPEHIAYPEGYAMAQLFCDAKYEMSLTVVFEWLKDGSPVKYTDRVYKEKRISGPSRILFFKQLVKEDAGKYTCHVYTLDGNYKVSEDMKTGALGVEAVPESPLDVQLNGTCDQEFIKLSWKPGKSYNAPLVVYNIEYAIFGSAKNWYLLEKDGEVFTTDKTVYSINIKKQLPSSNVLEFRVITVAQFRNSELKSTPSKSATLDCPIPAAAPLRNPSNVRSKVEGKGKLTILWDPLPEIFSSRSDSYIIQYENLKNGTKVEKEVSGDITQFVIPDPGVNQTYKISVRTKNSIGRGPEPKEFIFTSGVEAFPGKVMNLKQSMVKAMFVRLTWDPVDTATSYKLSMDKDVNNRRRRGSHGPSSVLNPIYPEKITTNAVNISSLTPNTKYQFTVAAVNPNGAGEESSPLIVQTLESKVPGVPENVKFQLIGDAIKVSWVPPQGDNENILRYEVRWYKTNEKTPKKETMPREASSRQAFITEKLDMMTYYSVELVAISDAGEGKPYLMEGLVVGYPDKPGKPGKPFVDNLNSSTMAVTFVLPDDYFGGMPDKFNAFYSYNKNRRRRDNHVMKISSPYPAEETVTISSLKVGAYTVQTSGENAMGESVKSDPSTVGLLPPSVIPVADDSKKAFYEEVWFLILIIVLVLLILLVLIIYCCCNKRGGGKYPVEQKEKQKGEGEPLVDYASIPMDEKKNGGALTPTLKTKPVQNSQNSIDKKPIIDVGEEDDADSLDDYGEDTKFKEDGSFIGQYGGDEEKKLEGTTLV